MKTASLLLVSLLLGSTWLRAEDDAAPRTSMKELLKARIAEDAKKTAPAATPAKSDKAATPTATTPVTTPTTAPTASPAKNSEAAKEIPPVKTADQPAT